MSMLTERLRDLADRNETARWQEDEYSAIDELREAAAEIERLQAIVSRLPRTADGMPIAPGMKLWTVFDGSDVTVNWFCRGHGTGVWLMDTDRGNRTESECYSTREAAEKARLAG